MRRVLRLCLSGGVLVFSLMVFSGCKKEAPPPAPPPPRTESRPSPPPDPVLPAPTIRISASPSSIERTSQTTLRWDSSNAASVVIDNGVGNVTEQGSVVITPLQSTTYTATATGGGGEAKASARVTVIAPASKAPLTTDQMQIEDLIDEGRFRPVFFAYDKSDLSEEAKAVLQENARYLRQYPDSRILIEGHCDERGSEEYNLALGDLRSRTAHDFLVQLGVETNRMNTISFGEERPFDPALTEAAFAKNRRAHFRGGR
ncbi:MAG: OmpA family protein [Acidobacteriota bacterium]